MISSPNKIFLINISETEGYLSPLFFQYKPKPLRNIKKLREIATVNETRSRPKFDDDQLVPYVGLPETDEKSHSIINVVLRPYKEVAGRNIIFKNELLFARIEPSVFNKKYILTKDLKGYDFAFTSTEFYTVRGNEVSNDYLLYCFLSDYVFNQIAGKTTGSTGRRRLDPEVFKKIKIPIPSLSLRNRIEGIYQTAFQKKHQKEQKAKALLDSIDEYLLAELGIKIPEKDNSLPNRIFTTTFKKVSGNRFDPKIYSKYSQALISSIDKSKYPTTALKNLITHSIAGNWGIDENIIDEDYEKCLVIRATEFDNNFNLNLVNDRLKYRQISKEKLAQLDIQENDLLIEKSGGSPDQPVGRIAIITKEILSEHKICYSNFVHKIRIDETKILPEYLFCFLKTIHNIKITDIMQSQTSGIRNLIMHEYFNQSIVIPDDLKVQKQISDKANKMRTDAKKLFDEANEELENARQQVEKIILEDE